MRKGYNPFQSGLKIRFSLFRSYKYEHKRFVRFEYANNRVFFV